MQVFSLIDFAEQRRRFYSLLHENQVSEAFGPPAPTHAAPKLKTTFIHIFIAGIFNLEDININKCYGVPILCVRRALPGKFNIARLALSYPAQ